MIFGSCCIRPTALAEIVRTKVLPKAARLREKESPSNDERTRRTKAVKTILRREGRRRGFKVFPNPDQRLKKRASNLG